MRAHPQNIALIVFGNVQLNILLSDSCFYFYFVGFFLFFNDVKVERWVWSYWSLKTWLHGTTRHMIDQSTRWGHCLVWHMLCAFSLFIVKRNNYCVTNHRFELCGALHIFSSGSNNSSHVFGRHNMCLITQEIMPTFMTVFPPWSTLMHSKKPDIILPPVSDDADAGYVPLKVLCCSHFQILYWKPLKNKTKTKNSTENITFR